MSYSLEKSAKAFVEAKQYIPGGVNSPVRSFRNVGGTPPFIASAAGSRLRDIDGNVYVDYVLSWGPMILGHAHPAVVSALQDAVSRGTSYGAPTLLETELSQLIHEALPSMELVRMVNSGTEATMSALRLARGYTGRDLIVKFNGCYHGHHDSLLVAAGSGCTTFCTPDSPGVPAASASTTLIANYNDLPGLAELFSQHGERIAAVIIEPVAGNMGMVLPKEGYLQGIQNLCRQYGALLIFDEVMTGFRVAHGGAQVLYGITPDITCLGKVIGGGLPVAAYGGRRDIMEKLSPAGPVYQAGTLSGNPLAMTAGIVTLRMLKSIPDFYPTLQKNLAYLVKGLQEQAEKQGLQLQFHSEGTMFGLFFSEQPVYDYDTAKASDLESFAVFHHTMLQKGIYLAPSQFEAGFFSYAHTEEDVAATLAASAIAFVKVREYRDGR